ncbi:MAG: beta-ketoacyl-[acyl-carrier-protein] synthase family protein [Chitinophagaceae bacterium]|nr:beta-ketoacyl-[acyl-carrier-protein] synthase family protein [Chitinophagaceae bacterium]
MPEKVVVTGVGLFTALGKGVQQNFNMLKQARHGLRHLRMLETKLKNDFFYGEIEESAENLARSLGITDVEGTTRTSVLGMHAIQEAMQQSGINLEGLKRTAFINASTVGGMCEVEKYYFQMLNDEGDYTHYSDTIDIADCTHRMADFFCFDHLVTSISTACSSSANAIQFGARLLQHQEADYIVCGGTDGLSKFTINGFNSLKNIDRNLCRPFDQNRNGLNLGEGAAYVILERESQAKHRGATILAVLNGYSNFNESFHPTAPNPQGEGAYQVMKRALVAAGLKSEQIDYINAHGTATMTNDESESNAMKRLFHDVPVFSSTKPFTGHTLAAAGAVEAVFSILAIQHQCVFPNLNFSEPMESGGLIPQLEFESKPIQHVMTNSYAFGGNNTSLIFSAPNSIL